MTIVSVTFTKMTATKSGAVRGQVNIKNNVTVTDVEKADLSLGKAKQGGLKYTFAFSAKYDPEIGEITLNGEVLDLQEEKKAEEIAKEWNKSKKIDPLLMTQVLSAILNKCNVQALILSRDINLPPPIPLPRVTPGKEA